MSVKEEDMQMKGRSMSIECEDLLSFSVEG